MDPQSNQQGGYNKRPLWQWILLYLVIGIFAYGLLYYFVLNRGGSGAGVGGGPPSGYNSPAVGNPNTGALSPVPTGTGTPSAGEVSPTETPVPGY